MNTNKIKLTHFGSYYEVEINDARIGGVTSYALNYRNDGHIDLTLTISTDAEYSDIELAVRQPSENGGGDCTTST